MNDLDTKLLVGLLLLFMGLGTVIFGGESRTGLSLELFGFDVGFGKSRRMGKLESIFWGLFFMIFGITLLVSGDHVAFDF